MIIEEESHQREILIEKPAISLKRIKAKRGK